jgi:hypothetical protein
VDVSGPVTVLILSGFLAGRCAPDRPMSLFAGLVFKQSYGGVEGDSASSAELFALLSALADIPLRQDLERFPVHLNRKNSQSVKDGRICRH